MCVKSQVKVGVLRRLTERHSLQGNWGFSYLPYAHDCFFLVYSAYEPCSVTTIATFSTDLARS